MGRPGDDTRATGSMPGFLRELARQPGATVRLAAGDMFIRPGQDVDTFAVVLSGSLRVYQMGENGREITLYGVDPGECCLINVLCLISGDASPAAAVAQEPVEALVAERSGFLHWLDQRADFRRFVFGTMTDRMTTMLALVEEVAFRRLDCRLAAYLANGSDGPRTVTATHDAIAADLGTAREVVSRLLKSFERQGAIDLGRGAIKVKDPALLKRIALGP